MRRNRKHKLASLKPRPANLAVIGNALKRNQPKHEGKSVSAYAQSLTNETNETNEI